MTKMTKIIKIPSEGLLSYSLEVLTDKDHFLIPIVDVRDGDAWRKRAEDIEKYYNQSKGSKYFKATETWSGFTYNQSRKKR